MDQFKYYRLSNKGEMQGWVIDGGCKMYTHRFGRRWEDRKNSVAWDKAVQIAREELPLDVLMRPCTIHGRHV